MAVALGLRSASSFRSMTNMSVLEPPFSAMPVLVARAALAATFHSYDLPCTDDSAHVVIRFPKISAKFQGLSYSYPLFSNDDVLETLGGMFSGCFYSSDTRTMRVSGSADSITALPSLATHTSHVGADEQRDEVVVEVLSNEDLHGKKVSVPSFHLRKYQRREIWLTTCRAHEVANALRAVSQKHEGELV